MSLGAYHYHECRGGLRHSWEHVKWTIEEVRNPRTKRRVEVISRFTVCLRCMTERQQMFRTSTWERIGGYRYTYPNGYIIKGGGVRPADFRKELLQGAMSSAVRITTEDES